MAQLVISLNRALIGKGMVQIPMVKSQGRLMRRRRKDKALATATINLVARSIVYRAMVLVLTGVGD